MTIPRKVLALIGGITFANIVAVCAFEFPFLYCWFGPACRYLYLQWGLIGIYVALVFFCYQMWKGDMVRAFFALIVVVAVLELPQIADSVFRYGGSCGA